MQYNVPGGYAQLRLLFEVDGLVDPMGFTVGILDDSAAEAVVLANLVIKFRESVLEDGSLMGVGWRFLGGQLTTMVSGGPSIENTATSLSGSAAAPTVPPNSAVLVRKNTALGGRKNRGRIYFPPCTCYETQVDNAGFMAGPTVEANTLRWETWREDCEALGTFFYLYHQYDPDEGELPEIPTQITSFAVQAQLATQRLRMR